MNRIFSSRKMIRNYSCFYRSVLERAGFSVITALNRRGCAEKTRKHYV